MTFDGGSPSRRYGVSVTESAPAKLTLSLRITGVRSRRIARVEAEMVTIDLADALTFSEGSGTDRDRRGHRDLRTRCLDR